VQLAPLLAEETGGLGALGFDVPSLIVYLVNFLILVVLLRAVAYKPVLRMLEQRSARIKESLETAERVQAEARRQQEELQRQMEVARQEGQRVIEQARQLAEQYRQEERERVHQEAEVFMERARQEIQRERDNAVMEVRRQMGDLAILAAERIIERSLDPAAHRDIIERVLAEHPPLPRS